MHAGFARNDDDDDDWIVIVVVVNNNKLTKTVISNPLNEVLNGMLMRGMRNLMHLVRSLPALDFSHRRYTKIILSACWLARNDDDDDWIVIVVVVNNNKPTETVISNPA